MPFIGKDWRAPGDMWVRVNHTDGWELIKLRPIQLNSLPLRTNSDLFPADSSSTDVPLFELGRSGGSGFPLKRDSSGSPPFPMDGLLDVEDFDGSPPPVPSGESSSEIETNEEEEEPEDRWTPYCFVKLKNRTREFIGCTSMSEAFHRLDMARAVADIRRFNYICKVVQILVNEKLQNLSASSRRSLFAIIQAMVLHSVGTDHHTAIARDILSKFSSGLDSPHVCGSPQLVSRQQGCCSNLEDLIANMVPPHTLSEAGPENITFLELPREILSAILSKLPDHVSLLEAAKANETLQALVESEQRQWKTLCQFHFSQAQMDKHQQSAEQNWRQLFFTLKKYYGLRETYADLIHICCHCKALFWRDHGHPCVSKDAAAPSVRVTPQQFVDMLLFL